MVAQGPSRNLVLVHTPERQALSDWLDIKQKVEARAPDIEVRITDDTKTDHATLRWQPSRPSLVFSADRLMHYLPTAGTVYSGRHYDKAEQVARFERAGVPIPATRELTRGLVLDRALFGDYVVVKPLSESRGRGQRLVRTSEVAERFLELSMNGRRKMLVQRYIEPLEARPAEYRVLTMFGRALCCWLGAWVEPLAPLERIADDPEGRFASNAETAHRVRKVVSDADVIEVGERAHRAFPAVGVLGVDLVREASTGAVYVLECNPVGQTWHFSSRMARAKFPDAFVKELYAQFHALELAAELLVERARAEAH
jgi:hypothetical protein